MGQVTYWVIHLVLAGVVVLSRFDSAVVSVAIIVAIFSNLGESSSPYSAYSIFNKGCQYLLGDTRPDQVDNQLRGGPGIQIAAEGREINSEFINIPPKYINRPCPCGSGLKAKRCHGARTKPG